MFAIADRHARQKQISHEICAHPMAYDAACAQITALLQATMQPNQRVIEEATAHLAQAETQPGTMSFPSPQACFPL
jgi:hypothetical protein